MTKEEKQLLLKDLCGRLPYGVQIHIDFNENVHIVGDATLNTITSITGQFFNFTDFEQDFKNGDCCPISGFGSHKLLHLEDFKPYLRPISSLTADECDRLFKILDINEKDGDWLKINDINVIRLFTENGKDFYEIAEAMDYLYSIHVDFRDMIEKGLAIEVTEENNPYKN